MILTIVLNYVLGNPTNNIDPDGKFSLGLGMLFGGGAGWGFSIGFEAIIVHDDSKPLSEGWDFGFAFSASSGSYTGIGGGLDFSLSVTNANHISDLAGTIVSGGFSGGALGHAGLFGSVGFDANGKQSTSGLSLILGGGLGGAASLMVGNTFIISSNGFDSGHTKKEPTLYLEPSTPVPQR